MYVNVGGGGSNHFKHVASIKSFVLPFMALAYKLGCFNNEFDQCLLVTGTVHDLQILELHHIRDCELVMLDRLSAHIGHFDK